MVYMILLYIYHIGLNWHPGSRPILWAFDLAGQRYVWWAFDPGSRFSFPGRRSAFSILEFRPGSKVRMAIFIGTSTRVYFFPRSKICYENLRPNTNMLYTGTIFDFRPGSMVRMSTLQPGSMLFSCNFDPGRCYVM
jgi:hypothetical protein